MNRRTFLAVLPFLSILPRLLRVRRPPPLRVNILPEMGGPVWHFDGTDDSMEVYWSPEVEEQVRGQLLEDR
jgi:hypothetical protein